jgi:2-amino-4-hydroxy-6-hydroxymethyldihydropteridine diphosphokinase
MKYQLIMTKIVLALGGNIGDVTQNFNDAVKKLQDSGMHEIIKSSNYNTIAVDCPPGTPDFINAIIVGWWDDSAEKLLKTCQMIEQEAGRPTNHAKNSSRTLDLDIIYFGNQIIDNQKLTIPHPRAIVRRFVIEPLAEIDPDFILTGTGKTVTELLIAMNLTSNSANSFKS